MVDKLSLLGGGSKVSFGYGEVISPIRILINGRFTAKYIEEEVDYMQIVKTTIYDYFEELFPLLDLKKDLVIIDNTHTNEGPGVVYNKNNTNNDRANFFVATSKNEKERQSNHFRCNDTSTTVSYYPLSNLESLVLNIEKKLNSNEYKEKYNWLGSDIKVMGIRKEEIVEITACVPLIAKYTNDVQDYYKKLNVIKKAIEKMAYEMFSGYEINITLNSRDDDNKDDYYLTAIGSAIESGDEGAVGRGNRSRGVIPFVRNFSMEASCGKNPVYHTGKLFTAIGDKISEEIYKKYNIENTIYCTSKMGDSIINPWNISVELNREIDDFTKKEIIKLIETNINNHYEFTKSIINREIKLNVY